MAHQADNINIRIRDAVAWARAEHERLAQESLELPEGSDVRASTLMHAVAFSVATKVLEEVVEPGRHSTRPGWSVLHDHLDGE